MLFRGTKLINRVISRHLSSGKPLLDSSDSSGKLDERQKKLMARGLPKKKPLEGVSKVILVASGKGGVGKSTTAVNLALGLSSLDLSVGILDADVYGPSIPTMMNLMNLQPEVSAEKKIVPLQNYGLKCMSMGFLVKERDAAVIWRGPMVMGATEKMIFQTDWAPLDCLVIDMPPGTGDIHLSIAQTLQVSGAVVVSTPQEVALADARKAITMFSKVDIPVLGIVENMNAFVCGHCKEVTHVFGKEGAQNLAKGSGVDLLGSVPLDPDIMGSSDSGVPLMISHRDSKSTQIYKDMAGKVKLSLHL